MDLKFFRASCALCLVVGASGLSAQRSAAGASPRSSVAAFPAVLLSPDRSKLLVMERSGPDTSSDASPELRLGGLQVDPHTNASAPRETWSALIVQPIGRGEIRRLILPWKARVGSVLWSPDGHRVAFTILEQHGTSLWVSDAYTGVIRMLAGPVLNAATGEPCQWFPSGDALLCSRIPAGRGAAPAAAPADGALLPASRDSRLFAHYFTGQLVAYSLSGEERAIGEPGIHSRVSISPDDKYLLVESVRPPYADGVALERFPMRSEIREVATGATVKVVQDRATPTSASGSDDEVPPGPRALRWRGDRPSTVVWAEAQDGGSSAGAPVRDRLFQLDSPFQRSAVPIASLEWRSREIAWAGHERAIVSEGWSRTGRSRHWLVRLDGSAAPRLLLENSADNFVTTSRKGGGEMLVTARQGRMAYLRGPTVGSTPAYLAQIDLLTGKTERIWSAEGSLREMVVGMIDPDEGQVITMREADAHPTNYFLRDLRKNGITPLTRFK